MSRELLIEHWFDYDLSPATGTPSGAMSGTATITFGQSGTLIGAGALSATNGLTFGQSGVLTGTGALAATNGLTFGQSGTLTGIGALTANNGITFGQSGTLTGAGVLTATNGITFGQSAALTGSGALAGTNGVTFGQSGTLLQPGLNGTIGITFGQSGILTGTGSLSGSDGITLGSSSTLTGTGALAGQDGMVFGVTGTLTNAQNGGTGSLSFNAFGTLTAIGGEGAGRRTRTIYRVVIDGHEFYFKTLAEAQQFLQRAPAKAEELAAKVERGEKPAELTLPKIEVPTELKPIAQEVRKSIRETYERALAVAEIRMLMALAEREEDDTIFWLM